MKLSFALFVLTTGPLLLATGIAAAKLAASVAATATSTVEQRERERERELTSHRKKRRMKYAKSSKKSSSHRRSKPTTRCKFEKNSKDFDHVLEEYDQLLEMTVFNSGIPDILDPPVDNFVSTIGDERYACAEDAAVACARRCDDPLREGPEFEEECTTFGLIFVEDVEDDGYVVCNLYNNNNNVFQPQRISPTVASQQCEGQRCEAGTVYNNKVRAPPLLEGTRTEGLFPPNLMSPSTDFLTFGVPAVVCVAAYSGVTDPLNNIPAAVEAFQSCQDCFEKLARAEATCIGAVAGACGVPNLIEDYNTIFIYGGEITNLEKYKNTTLFSDDEGGDTAGRCGLQCKAGASSDYVCRSTLQTFYLAILNQDEFGCTTSNIRNPITGAPFPDYTCPPNTDQRVPNCCTTGAAQPCTPFCQ